MKHKEIAKAWLDGKPVQIWWDKESKWKDFAPPENEDYCPAFRDVEKFRIKPTTVKVRIYRTVGGDMYVATKEFDCRHTDWVSEIVEIEVKE